MLQEWSSQQPVGSDLHSTEGIVTGTRAHAWLLSIVETYELKTGKVRCPNV